MSTKRMKYAHLSLLATLRRHGKAGQTPDLKWAICVLQLKDPSLKSYTTAYSKHTQAQSQQATLTGALLAEIEFIK